MKTKFAILGIVISIFILGTTFGAYIPVPAHSQGTPDIFVVNPTNPANPAAQNGTFKFSTATTSVGFKFNVTLWATNFVDTAVFAWQVTLSYNTTILNATRAFLGGASDPNYILFGHSSVRAKPFFGPNYVKMGDTSLDTSVTSATPKLLGTIEFQVIFAPTSGSVSCVLDINNVDTFLLDDFLSEIPSNKISGSYELSAPPAPDFTMLAAPDTLIIIQGNSDKSRIDIRSINGFNSAVSLSISGVPTGVTATFNPTSVTPPPDGVDNSTLTVTVGLTVTPDIYPLTVTGTSGALTHTATIELTVNEIPPTPDFTIAASPDTLSIVQGGSETSTITVTSVNGFNAAVDLGLTGLPTGATFAFNPASVTPTATSTLTIDVGLSTAVDTYPLIVSGTSGILEHDVSISLTVTAAPDFTIAASPTTISIVQGDSGTSTITVTSLNGFSSTVDLSISGLPTGATGTFAPASVTPTATSTLTIDVAASTVADTYTLTVTGTSGSLTHDVTISLTVIAAAVPDFTIVASPASLSIAQGDSGTSTITITSVNGFNAAVNLDLTGLPTGATFTFTPASVTPPADGSANSTLTINVDVSTAAGTYPLAVTGTSGSLTHDTPMSLTVTIIPVPDFEIAASPDSLSIVQGSSGTSTITVTSVNSFSSAVDLTIAGLPTGVTGTFSPASVTPTGTSTLTIDVAASTVADTYILTVTGTSGSLSHDVTISLTVTTAAVPDFTIAASPTTLSIVQGGSGTSTITLTSVNGFNSEVALTILGLPTDATGTFSPASVTPTATSTLTVDVGASTAVGTYTLTVTGTSGALVHDVTISLTVTAAAVPDFEIAASPTSLSIVQGGSGTSTITLTSLNGFNSEVALTISGLPTGATGTFSPASVTPTATSTLAVDVALSTAIGTYPLTVTGTSGALSHDVSISLTVTAVPPAPDFSISATPTSKSIVQGSSGTWTIVVASLNGFTGAVDLTISGLPTGATGTFVPASLTGNATSTLTVNVALSTVVGTYPLTVTGTSGALSHTASISLNVTAAPDFSIAASPTSLSIVQGGSGTSTITVTSLNDFSSAVALTISGLPTGATGTFSPASVTPTATSTLTINVGMSTAIGTYTLTVTGTSGTLNHSTTISLTVTQAQVVITAKIIIQPQTLNLRSSGKAIIAFIILPQGFNGRNIDISTITINGTVHALPRPTAVVAGILIVKFDRAKVQQLILNSIHPLKKTMTVTLTLTGSLKNGTPFQGSDTIKVTIPPGQIHKDPWKLALALPPGKAKNKH